WGKAWQVVLAVVGVETPYRRLVVTYYAATFANYVTPLGQAGGEPFIAYVLSRDTEASYQDSLASVVTADLLNLLPFFNFAAVGLGWLLLQAGLPEGAENLAWGLVAMALGTPGLVYVGWRHRGGVEAAVLRLVGPVATRTDRLSVAGVRRRIDEFYAALERIADSPRMLLYALVFSYSGWVLFALPLLFGSYTLGSPIDPLVVLFIVPASTLAGLVPTPGGTGAVESALVVLLLALTPLAAGQAFALAVVYRVASYWFAILAGGLAALWVTVRV
ncbi:MAG: flippase-like domain-containing protein, partial [Halobacteriales archaeon]